MKNITLIVLATFAFTACTTPFESFGEFSRKQLQNSEHNSWFMDNYDAHPSTKHWSHKSIHCSVKLR
ncbi:MAG: hypothetical protein CM15mP59_3140 [Flavobacteriaceae bacterium]|nr:MAG: hypothetical protein CM15mP59_3140 [Flavobacteriaceae bacterium]